MCYQNAVRLCPDYAEAIYRLGNALQVQGRLEQAIGCYERTVRLIPDSVAAYFNMGNALLRKGRPRAAITCYQRSVELDPDLAEAHCNMGTALKASGRLNEAIRSYETAVHLKPDYGDAINNLGTVLHLRGEVGEAMHCFQKALTIQPDSAEAHNNLGNAFKDQGQVHEAIRCYQRALRIRPDYAEAHSNILFAMHYIPGTACEDIFRESQLWWDRHGKPCSGVRVHTQSADPEKRLRVGYVSPDLREHSVSHFFLSLLQGHDKSAVEAICYADVTQPDDMTRRLQGLAGQWRSIVGLSHEDVARTILHDGIDILVDLAGHTENNRLLVFAKRPAPIQVTWLGYPNTTGMPVMDYRLTDDVADPRGIADRTQTEKLVRLPHGFLCYTPPENVGEVSSLPALKRGRVCFGSFNNPAKVNEKVIEVWSRVLREIPGSSLMLKGKALTDGTVRDRYLKTFSRYGISSDRIELVAYVPKRKDHFALYSRVDIGLDPFPYNGTTTTCEALWMGVPVVTLRGDRHVSRVGASILTQAGLKELIASTEAEYVQRAVVLSTDLERLEQLRSTMRERLKGSVLCDAKRFAASMETAFRNMWRQWCLRPCDAELTGSPGYGDMDDGSVQPEERTAPTEQGLTGTEVGGDEAHGYYEKGLSLQLKGHLKPAVACYQKALALDPHHADACNNMGVAYQELGDIAGALKYLKRAVSLRPDYIEGYNNLGNAFQHAGDLDRAVSCYKRVLKLNPDLSQAHNNLGNVHLQKGAITAAMRSYKKGVALDPKNAEAHCNMGNALQYMGRCNEALEWYKKSIALNADNPAAYNNMGAALQNVGRLEEAFSCQQEAIRRQPGNADAYNNMGRTLKDQGRIPEAIRCYKRALEIRPDFAEAHSNLLFALHYDPEVSQERIFTESQAWWQMHGTVHFPEKSSHNGLKARQRLKVGYVSPDFREHSVSYFFKPLLEKHHPDAVETFCYADVKRPDAMTSRIKGLPDHWRSIEGWSDEDVARRIYKDRIDILVDLAGHTAHNRLLVFARRPAPVQVTWLGYPDTTGMPVMDYRLTDDLVDPKGEADRFHTEKLIRLAHGFLCYEAPEGAGSVSSLPALDRSGVCFGSFNYLPKVNEEVVRVWSKILKAVPSSRLLLKSRPLADKGVRSRYAELFNRWGVSPERIQFEAYSPTTQGHLSLYNRVDIGLDPFPYNGTTTTCEALWMGAPVVTLKGDRHSARVGASILTRMGLHELICATEADYVKKATELAFDLTWLNTLRTQMRDRLSGSPLCDAVSFAETIESSYQAMWKARCGQESG
ncbi:MAG: tetratricopeptide repeat protein [Deltaproteobacteria bacterium]|nr:tetratricopeptide repeat protein [Deltaproteobacteria bacterium]MCF8119496.1 tetratricopeptide repeat protein [Deltaproteobacteria bacterium]